MCIRDRVCGLELLNQTTTRVRYLMIPTSLKKYVAIATKALNLSLIHIQMCIRDRLAGGVGQISVKVTGSAYTAKIPGLSKIPVIGGILFNYGFLTYLCIIIAVLLSFFLFKTRAGLNLRAIGVFCVTPSLIIEGAVAERLLPHHVFRCRH